MKLDSFTWENITVTPFQSGPILNNTYLLAEESKKECTVIDPSFNFSDVLQEIEARKLNFNQIWLTHGHFDHYIGIAEIKEQNSHIPVYMHPLDKSVFESGGESSSWYSGDPDHISKKISLPDHDLTDKMNLYIGKYEFTVFLTPGHSPGSCCFYFKPAGWLFSGDTVFHNSYGRTDLEGGSETDIMKSIHTRILTLPDKTIIYPGHEEFSTIAEEKEFYL